MDSIRVSEALDSSSILDGTTIPDKLLTINNLSGIFFCHLYCGINHLLTF